MGSLASAGLKTVGANTTARLCADILFWSSKLDTFRKNLNNNPEAAKFVGGKVFTTPLRAVTNSVRASVCVDAAVTTAS